MKLQIGAKDMNGRTENSKLPSTHIARGNVSALIGILRVVAQGRKYNIWKYPLAQELQV